MRPCRIFQGSDLVVAGYSVGDLTAHAVSGAISVDDALSLAKARAQAMDRVVDSAGVALGMTGVRGLSIPAVETMIAQSGVEIALVNGRDHIVLGGPLAGLDKIESNGRRERCLCQAPRCHGRVPHQLFERCRR